MELMEEISSNQRPGAMMINPEVFAAWASAILLGQGLVQSQCIEIINCLLLGLSESAIEGAGKPTNSSAFAAWVTVTLEAADGLLPQVIERAREIHEEEVTNARKIHFGQ